MFDAFETAAEGTISEAYKEDPKVCMINMTVRWERFRRCSLLNIAWGAHSKRLIGTRPAQEIIKCRWRGEIRRHVAFYKSFFVSLFPILLVFPKIIPFRPSVIFQIDGDTADTTKDKKRVGFNAWITRVKAFYNSPTMKFNNHAIFYLLFLVLHTKVVLVDMGNSRDLNNPWIMALCGMVALYAIEEVRQIFTADKGFRFAPAQI